VTSGTKINTAKFEDVRVNRGHGYNPSTGVFTAPRKGLYHISCLILGMAGHAVHYQLNKNDALYTKGYSSDHLKLIKHNIYIGLLAIILKLPWIIYI
jgi:hypothetical protein